MWAHHSIIARRGVIIFESNMWHTDTKIMINFRLQDGKFQPEPRRKYAGVCHAVSVHSTAPYRWLSMKLNRQIKKRWKFKFMKSSSSIYLLPSGSDNPSEFRVGSCMCRAGSLFTGCVVVSPPGEMRVGRAGTGSPDRDSEKKNLCMLILLLWSTKESDKWKCACVYVGVSRWVLSAFLHGDQVGVHVRW